MTSQFWKPELDCQFPETKIKHFYQNVYGYFTFHDYYSHLVRRLKANPATQSVHGVEVGCFGGQSASYLLVEAANAGLEMRLDLVDRFVDFSTDTVKQHLAPVASCIGECHAGNSWDMAAMYSNKSLDFVFIDADHSYESVAKDIDAWRSKVKQGGFLAGHDFCATFSGVVNAVTERFPRVMVFQGSRQCSDPKMCGTYWPVWSVQL